MKILIYSFLLFYIQISFAQKSFYTEISNQGNCEFASEKLIELQNGNFVGYANSWNCDNLLRNIPSYLFKLDLNGKVISEKDLNKSADSSEVFLDIIDAGNNSLIAIGETYDFLNEKLYLSFFTLDYNLKIINKKNFENESIKKFENVKSYIDNKQVYFAAEIQDSSNYYGTCIGFSNIPFDKLNINKSFKTSLLDYASISGTAKIKDNSGNFILGEFNMFKTYDKNLKLLKEQASIFPDNIIDLVSYKDKYITIAQSRIPLNPSQPFTSPDRREVGIRMFDKNFKELKHAFVGKGFDKIAQKDTYDISAVRAVSWKDPNKLFVSGSSIPNFSFVPAFEIDAWVFVSKLDSNLNVKWTKYFWDIGHNISYGVLATNDGGVVVYGNRDSLNTALSNAFVMKLNENGFLTKDEEVLEDNIFVTIGPNPFRSQVTFAIGTPIDVSEKLEVAIFDVQGRFLQKEKLTAGLNKLNLDSYASGTYLYSIFYKGKNVKQGKLVKIE